MTQAEMESSIANLQERLAQMEAAQQRRTKMRGTLATVSIGVAIGSLLFGAVLLAMGRWFQNPSPSPQIFSAIFTVAPLALLARALWAEAA